MRSFIRFNRPLVATLIAVVAALSVLQVAYAGPDEPSVPPKITVGEGHKVFLVGHAAGVQIYACNPVGGGFGWGLVAPRANLYDDDGKLIVTHFGGPTWLAKDGSKAVGQVVDRVTVDPTAIQWLLLSTASTPGPDGDRLAHTTYIQRIATTGGLAPPAAECNVTTAGNRVEVDYTADYYFWKEISA